MNGTFKDFQNRLRSIDRKAKSLEAGYTPKVRRDGLIELHPERKSLMFRLPVKTICMVLGAVIAYKAFLLSQMGEASYVARLSALSDGTVTSKIGSTIMQIDPLTRLVTDFIAPYLT